MDLEALRKEITAIDDALVPLFCRRMAAAGQVAAYKQAHGMPVLDAAREEKVLARVADLAGKPFAPYARTLYGTMLDVSKAYQRAQMPEDTPLTEAIGAAYAAAPAFPRQGVIACQGVEGAYGQQAAQRLFERQEIIYCRTFEAVFQAVEHGLCQFGVLPIENSTFGSVGSVYDLMRRHRFHIVRSVRLPIKHGLLTRPGVKLSQVREVFSHEQAIGQCGGFLAAHPEIKVTACENTAVAAKRVAESGRSDAAAIASAECAQLYGLDVLAQDIQNSDNNQTRFLCIARELAIYEGADRISIMLGAQHQPGALHRVLARFAALNLNITKLESRPAPEGDFTCLFYLDVEASVDAPETISLLKALAEEDPQFVFLGSYQEV